ncbi:hypothetical protein FS842_011460 [Serendipita sp. 407]|nr:hypothetical protein FS842_011460 [Serendipita sp. 407]
MNVELQRYELLANPNPSKPVKSKAPAISETLSGLSQRLKKAREQLANQPEASPAVVQQVFQATLADIETSKAQIDERLKETHASGTKIGKLIDKKTSLALPEYSPMFQGQEASAALRRTVGQHLVRTGALRAADIFQEESGTEIDPEDVTKFEEMRTVTEALRNNDVQPALRWVEEHRAYLESRDSPLEFLLHRSEYLRILSKSSSSSTSEPPAALGYAERHLLPLYPRYPADIPKLFNSMLLGEKLSSTYPELASPAIHTQLEDEFTREYCAERQISHQAPLKVVSTIGGGIALPRIEKGKKIMKEKRGEWSHTEEIPVEIPLPPEHRYHSIFTCPVSKEQATDVNPPMILQCGHVIARESLHKLIKGQTRVKCPYCPKESDPRQAVQLFF